MTDEQARQQIAEALKYFVGRYGKDETIVMCRTTIVTLFGKSNLVIVDKSEASPEFTTYGHSSRWHKKKKTI
jgi:hypothetical protein